MAIFNNIGLMSYFLGIEVKQSKEGVFISQKAYAKEVFKTSKIENCKSISTLTNCGIKLSKYDEGTIVDSILYKSLIGSLKYLNV